MAPTGRSRHLAALAILITAAYTQPTPTTSGGRLNGTSAPSSTSQSGSSTSPDSPQLTEAIVPAYLFSAVGSLITQYFPSTTPIDLPAVSWPSTLVVGTATYVFPAQRETSTSIPHSATAPDPSPTSSASNKQSASQGSEGNDKKLGIILGVVIGAVALAIMAVLFCCLARRRRRTGSFFMRRSMSSTGSRRLGALGTGSYLSGDSSNRRNMSDMRQSDPALLRPGMVHHQSSQSTSEDVPFYTPMERRSALFAHRELEGRRIEQSELDHHEPAHRRSSSPVRDARPPTPFSPAMMQHTVDRTRQQPVQDPFASPEDHETNYVVSPILPSKSFERWNPSIVHYPSMDEMSEFDFAGRGGGRRQVSGDGSKYWHPTKQRVDGRYELA